MQRAEALRKQLDDVVSDGLAIDLFHAEEALALLELIGTNAGAINKAFYGSTFGSLQVVLGRHLILATTKLFEPEDPKYSIRSVPVALSFLKAHAATFPIKEKQVLVEKLCELRKTGLALEASDETITTLWVSTWKARIPSKEKIATCPLSKALNQLKTARDKKIAHNEAIQIEPVPDATYGEIAELLTLAKTFIRATAKGYLSVHFDEADAMRAAKGLKELLVAARIL